MALRPLFCLLAQWLSGRVLDLRLREHGFEPHLRHCLMSLSKNINPGSVLVQPRKTRPYITERLLMEHKESNQTKSEWPFKTGFTVVSAAEWAGLSIIRSLTQKTGFL